jgi:hypothetical protein
MKLYKNFILCKIPVIACLFSFSFIIACKTIPQEIAKDEHRDYLQPDANADEAFRVLVISDRYDFIQLKYHDQFKRTVDADGDKGTSAKLKEYDKIDETCEGVLSVWLFPETGKIMRIRPKTLAPIAEINSLIVEDLKRWTFEIPGEKIEQNTFDIKYRVVLRKLQSDEEIMKEVQEKIKKDESKKQSKNID